MRSRLFFTVFIFSLLVISLFKLGQVKQVFAAQSMLIAPSVTNWQTEASCMPKDPGDGCTPNICPVTSCKDNFRNEEVCTHQSCQFGSYSGTFYWDGLSNVWISGHAFDSNFTPLMMLAGPQDNSTTCNDNPVSFGGSGRCDFSGYTNVVKGSMLIDDRAAYTINGYVIDTYYNQKDCEWINARSPIKLNDNSPLNNTTIPPGTLRLGNNTLTVSYHDVCGQDYRSQTAIYVVTDGSFSPTFGTILGKVFIDHRNSCNPNDTGQESANGQIVNVNKSGFSGNPFKSTTSNPDYSFTNLPVDGSVYSLNANNPAVGRMLCCDQNATVDCSVVPTSQNQIIRRDIAFQSNLPWLNVFDGDAYGGDGLTINIPTQGAGNSWLINRGSLQAAGAGISGGEVVTRDQPLGVNHTSQNGPPPGWQVRNHPEFKHLTNFKFQSQRAETFPGWNALSKDKSFQLNAWLPPTSGQYSVPGGGVATIWVSRSIAITQNLITAGPSQGVVIIVDGSISIAKEVSRVDAVLISNSFISVPGESPEALTVNGGIYSLGGFYLQRKFAAGQENVNPAISINFRPVYLTNLNPDLVRHNYFWEELPPQ